MNNQERTPVNHEAINVNSIKSDPYDDALAFRSLLGAVHNEFNHMVNNNMVSESNTLKKINGKQILEKGIKELMGKQTPVSQIPKNIDQQLAQPIAPQPSPNVSVVPQPIPAAEINVDPNQLELNFDNSATAQKIYDKIEDIEIKLNKILNLLSNKNTRNKK